MICEIIENLYVSDYENAKQKANEFNLIINCTKQLSNINLNTIQIPVYDINAPNYEIIKHWINVLPIIDKTLLDGGKVLIHCYAGVSRSASTCAAYILYTKRYKIDDINIDEIINLIKNKKEDAFHNGLRFKGALLKYKNYLKNQQISNGFKRNFYMCIYSASI
jgi:predicted protein tyrosine phosphatase